MTFLPITALGAKVKPCLVLVCAAFLACVSSVTQAQRTPNSATDETFLQLRDAAQRNNVQLVDRLASQIPRSHPLHAFAEYWSLKVRQPDVTDASIKTFLERHAGTFVADRLRNDWLLMLGKRGDWKQFDEQHPQFVLADDAQVDCYAAASKLSQGITAKAQARQAVLRSSSTAASEGCVALVQIMHANQQFTNNDVLDVVHVLLEGKRLKAATQLAGLIGISASDIEHAANTPNKALSKPSTRNLRSLALAAQARAGQWGNEIVGPHAAVQGASACAQRLGAQCSSWFKPGGQLIELPADLQGLGSDTALEWALRGVLREQDWRLLADLTQRLPTYLQQDPTWTYWHARALQATQRGDAAKPLFEKLVNGYGFYHLLAREALGQPLSSAHVPKGSQPEEAQVRAIMAREEVQRMSAFYSLGLRWEGNREWNWMMRGLSDAQLINYAEAGRRLGHLDRMINTADRSKVQHDFAQRFPMPLIDIAQPIANGINLDTNWVYGLMRQESRFIQTVRSHVGAQGLMQLMPATANWVAKKINVPNYSLDRVNEPEINLTLGQNYLSMVLADLDNQPILATAAYNAGPGRPRAWRSTLPAAVEGAIFAETIPFNETRGYVKQVLTNATIYGAMTGNKPRALSQWLGTVAPKGVTPTNLP